jgi:hypothetical protein
MVANSINIVVADLDDKGGNGTLRQIKKYEDADGIFVKTNVSKSDDV